MEGLKINFQFSNFQIFKKKNIILLLIILIGAFLRFYRLPAYVEFLGDQGRDILQVRDFLVNQDLMFIGPRTSVGDMYLGPWYYYLMAPFLLFADYSPLGPVVMVILFSLATVYLLYKIGSEWFNRQAGIIAAGFGALSPVLIKFSTFSWNPNIMPFFSLLSIWLTYRIWQKKEYKKLIWLAIALAMVLNSHYLGLLLFPPIGLFILLTLIRDFKNNKKPLIKNSIVSLLAFGLLMSPLLIFDLKHDWMNFNAFKNFFLSGQSSASFNLNSALKNMFSVGGQVSSQLFLNKDYKMNGLVILPILLIALCGERKKKSIQLLAVVLIFSLLGLATYNNSLYAHYFGFLYPFLILIFAYLVSKLKNFGWLLCFLILGLMFANWHGWSEPNYQLQRTRQTAQLIIKESSNQPFALALLAENNYDDSYEYFLRKNRAKLIDLHQSQADQLFVICEYDDKENCQPLGNPKWQVAVFGVAEFDNQWQVDGRTIYRLIRKND